MFAKLSLVKTTAAEQPKQVGVVVQMEDWREAHNNIKPARSARRAGKSPTPPSAA